MTRFKDDKAPWMPRINGDRFRSRIVCVRSSTPGIHTRTRAYTHTHTHTHIHTYPHTYTHVFIRHSRSENRVYAKLIFDFPAISLLLRRGKGGGAFESCFFLSPLSSDFSVPRSFPIGNSITPWTVFRLWTIMWNWRGGGGWEPLWFRLLGFAAFCWINFDERNRTIVVVFFFYFTVTKEIL